MKMKGLFAHENLWDIYLAPDVQSSVDAALQIFAINNCSNGIYHPLHFYDHNNPIQDLLCALCGP